METNSIISQIGNTPLVKLIQASELTDCNIYGKAEYYNPGESIKDRAALFIVEDAIKNVRAGQLEYKTDKGGNVHASVGKCSLTNDKIIENIKFFF